MYETTWIVDTATSDGKLLYQSLCASEEDQVEMLESSLDLEELNRMYALQGD